MMLMAAYRKEAVTLTVEALNKGPMTRQFQIRDGARPGVSIGAASARLAR